MTERSRAAAVLLAVVVLGGCGVTEAESPLETVPGGPTAPLSQEPGQTYPVPSPPPPLSWGDDDQLSVVTWGSSSCPTGPVDVTVVGEQEIRLDIDDLVPGEGPCTADMAPYVTEVGLPRAVSPDEPVTVHLRYADGTEQTVHLPPAD